MNVYESLMGIYPELTDADFAPSTGTIELRDDSDGRGVYINKWEHELAQPTDEELGINPPVIEIQSIIEDVVYEVIVDAEPMPEIPEDPMVALLADPAV
jgi:hypothetical protein